MNARPHHRHSLFWPVIFIGVGVFWLLINLGLIATANLDILVNLWPLLLIALGLDLLFGHRFPLIGGLIGLATIALAVALVVQGPRFGLKGGSLGWGAPDAVKTETFSESVGQATSAHVMLELEAAPTTLTALSDTADAPANLIQARLAHTGQIEFTSTGGPDKTVRLRELALYFGPRLWWTSGPAQRWDIGLTPKIPLALTIDGGSGPATLDLSALQSSAFTLDAGSGEMQVDLPGGSRHYNAQLNAGSGSLNLALPAEADVNLSLNAASGGASLTLGSGSTAEVQLAGGSGHVEVNLPAEAAMRVEVLGRGSGQVHLPAALLATGESQSQTGDWQTASYEQATRRITLVISRVGSGSIDVH